MHMLHLFRKNIYSKLQQGLYKEYQSFLLVGKLYPPAKKKKIYRRLSAGIVCCETPNGTRQSLRRMENIKITYQELMLFVGDNFLVKLVV
jgi:hypothetical protein